MMAVTISCLPFKAALGFRRLSHSSFLHLSLPPPSSSSTVSCCRRTLFLPTPSSHYPLCFWSVFNLHLLTFLSIGGSMVARLKLKEIDGRAPQGVEPAA